MDDTSFSDNSFDGDASILEIIFDENAFASVAYNSGGDDDDGDISCSLTDEVVLSGTNSFASDDDIEDQQPVASDQKHGQSRRSSNISIHADRGRSKYAARRCKSVDIMTERLMIHADEYYKGRRETRRSKVLWCGCLAFGVLTLITIVIFVLMPSLQLQQPPQKDTSELVELPEAGSDFASQSTTLNRPNTYESAASVQVPFANKHNLVYDGLLFVKTSNSDLPESSNSAISIPAFDSYAKTLDPITELHFAPGESNTAKHIVLTKTAPDLTVDNGIQQSPSEMMKNDPGLVLSIGLEANGEVWLPQTTGQRISHVANHHSTPQNITKTIYGSGDRFVLTISHDAITLFRNDRHELVGIWKNDARATTTRTTTNILSSISTSQLSLAQPLYAQIWFKDPKSSMLATAWNDRQLATPKNGVH